MNDATDLEAWMESFKGLCFDGILQFITLVCESVHQRYLLQLSLCIIIFCLKENGKTDLMVSNEDILSPLSARLSLITTTMLVLIY